MKFVRQLWQILSVLLYFSILTKTETNVTNNYHNTNVTEASTGITAYTKIDVEVIREKIRDVGYYLRAHKFNEYDRRYETDAKNAERIYFKSFPRPPLRSLHWEVHKFCFSSFIECLNYLAKKVWATAARRSDDTSMVMKEQKWTWRKNEEQIKQVDEECLKNKKTDDVIADPFDGPLEKYQWRVTASYYMCWYTMKKTTELTRFFEKCDNFANCLDYEHGANNDDERVSDYDAFSCAIYSFCPDPCCPFKYLNSFKDCWNSPENPCHRLNPIGKRECSVPMEENTELSDIILNRWNVTCRCPQQGGYEWNSRYGICIDVDECVSKTHNCDPRVETCLNLPGSFKCICRWGYIWEVHKKECLPSTALAVLKLKKKEKISKHEKLSVWEKFKNILFRRNISSLNRQRFIYILFSCSIIKLVSF